MKQLIIKHSIFLSLVLFTACSTPQNISPSQNDALNKISNSNVKKENGSLQSLLDNFLQNEWIPTLNRDKEIREKYIQKEDKPFSLQEYVDKRAVYIKAHPSDHNKSNVHKLEMMPVIGKSRSR